MTNRKTFYRNFYLFSIAVSISIFILSSCEFYTSDSTYTGLQNVKKITVNPTQGKLTVTGLDNYNNRYVVAFGFNWNYEYLYAAEKIDSHFVLTGGKVTQNKVVLNIWKDDFDGTLIDYNDTGNFTFLVYVLNKREFKKAEEFIIGDYYYKGKPKPSWLEIIGLIRGSTNIDGICEAEFAEMEPL